MIQVNLPAKARNGISATNQDPVSITDRTGLSGLIVVKERGKPLRPVTVSPVQLCELGDNFRMQWSYPSATVQQVQFRQPFLLFCIRCRRTVRTSLFPTKRELITAPSVTWATDLTALLANCSRSWQTIRMRRYHFGHKWLSRRTLQSDSIRSHFQCSAWKSTPYGCIWAPVSSGNRPIQSTIRPIQCPGFLQRTSAMGSRPSSCTRQWHTEHTLWGRQLHRAVCFA